MQVLPETTSTTKKMNNQHSSMKTCPVCLNPAEYLNIIYDARGIPCGSACSHLCADKIRAKYRKDIFDNPNYEVDEDIDVSE